MKNKFIKLLLAILIILPSMFVFSACNDASNTSMQVRVGETYIQYSIDGTEWLNIISIADVREILSDVYKGDSGNNGIDGVDGLDASQILIREGETHIQWQRVGDVEWKDLISIDEIKLGIKGEKGDQGDKGIKGDKGNKGNKGDVGKSAYDLYCELKPNYSGSKADWMNSVLSGTIVNEASTYGDVNLDGNVTTDDKTLILRYVVGSETLTPQQLANADLNLDGKVTNADARLVSYYVMDVAGLTFPFQYLPGDFNRNGSINEEDEEIFINEYTDSSLRSDYYTYFGDINEDKVVDQSDMLELMAIVRNSK